MDENGIEEMGDTEFMFQEPSPVPSAPHGAQSGALGFVSTDLKPRAAHTTPWGYLL